MNEHDIDKLFSESLGGNSMSFDESAWAGAEKAIIAHEARKRRRSIIIWLVAGLLMISGVIGTYRYITAPSDTGSTAIDAGIDATESSKAKTAAMKENKTIQENPSEKPKSEEKESASTPSDTFKSNFSRPANGVTEKTPIVLMVSDENKKSEPNEGDRIEKPIDQTGSANTWGIEPLAIRDADLFTLGGAEVFDESAGTGAFFPLPEHWDTRLNIIAGILPLDYAQRSEYNQSNAPYYVGLGLSKIHNYSLEYGMALIYEEVLLSPNSKSIEQVQYSFTKTTTTHQIQRNRSAYLSAPIYIKYRLKGYHALTLGVQYSRLMQSYSRYAISETRSNNDTNFTEENSATGFNNDLSQNQISTILGYNLTLTDRLQFHIQGRLGINSLYKENIRPSAFTDRIHLRVGLEYSIWRR